MNALSYWSILFVGIFLSCSSGFIVDGNVSQSEYHQPLYYNDASTSPVDWFVTNNETHIVFAVKNLQANNATSFLGVALYMNPDPIQGPPVGTANSSWADFQILTFPFLANRFFLAQSNNATVVYSVYQSSNWVNYVCTNCTAKFSPQGDQVELAVLWDVFSDLVPVNGLQFWGRFVQGASYSSGSQEHGLPLSTLAPLDTSPQFYYDTFPYVRTVSGDWFTPADWTIGSVPVNTSSEYTQSCAVIAPSIEVSVTDLVHVTSLILNTNSVVTCIGTTLTVGSKNGNLTSVLYLKNSTTTLDASQGGLTLAAPVEVKGEQPAGTITVQNLTLTNFAANPFNTLTGGLTIDVLNEALVQKNLINLLDLNYKNLSRLRYASLLTTSANREWGDNSASMEHIPVKVVIESQAQITKQASDTGLIARGTVDVFGQLTLNCNTGITNLTIFGDLNVNGTISINCDLTVQGNVNIEQSGTVYCNDKLFFKQNGTPLYGMEGVIWNNASGSYALTPGDIIPVGNDGTTVTFPDSVVVSNWNLDNEANVCLNQRNCTFTVPTRFGQNVRVDLISGPNMDCPATFSFVLINTTSDLGGKLKSNGISGGAIAGIVIAAAVVSGAAVAAAFFFTRRRKAAALYNSESDNDLGEMRTSVESVGSVSSVNSLKNTMGGRRTLRDEWEIPYSQLSLGKELGRGAFGVVYKCRWRNTDCVVKQLDINKNDQQSISQFLREANQVQNLRSHPNVCTVFGVCTNPEYPICIVMEFVPEGSLDTLIYQRKILPDAKMVFEFAKDIASGMSHLHAENVLHCDLACRNLLVISRGNNQYKVKIADFGLSHFTETETYNASTTKTFPVRWTAPETLQSGKISRASDVWSFGVVLWEIVEGKRPYPDMSNADIIKAVCDKGYRLPKPDRIPIPDELYTLMTECWNQDPSLRPTFDAICKRIDVFQKTFFVEEDDGVSLPSTQKKDPENNNNSDYYNTGQVGLPGESNYNA